MVYVPFGLVHWLFLTLSPRPSLTLRRAPGGGGIPGFGNQGKAKIMITPETGGSGTKLTCDLAVGQSRLTTHFSLF